MALHFQGQSVQYCGRSLGNRAIRVTATSRLRPHRPADRGPGSWRALGALIVGLVVGALATIIMPGRDPGGILVTMWLGIGGAFVARLLGHALGMYHNDETGPGLIASVLGAIIILAPYRLLARRWTA